MPALTEPKGKQERYRNEFMKLAIPYAFERYKAQLLNRLSGPNELQQIVHRAPERQKQALVYTDPK